jgi:D-3-phosphoglycerate dehydrogenase
LDSGAILPDDPVFLFVKQAKNGWRRANPTLPRHGDGLIDGIACGYVSTWHGAGPRNVFHRRPEWMHSSSPGNRENTMSEKNATRSSLTIVIPDDYQDAVRELQAFKKLEGHEVTVFTDTVKDIGALAQRFAHAQVLVPIRERTAIGDDLLTRLPGLKLISQTGKGVTHIDVAACTRRGIAVATGSGSSHAPAELTWALLLAAVRALPRQIASAKAGNWQTAPIGTSLNGRTLGIYGYGGIGKIVAGYGKAFGMRVLVWGREGSVSRARQDGYDVATNKRAFFEQSDVVSLHLKLSADTNGIVTATDLACMKPTSVLINTSRADLIERDALVTALRAGRPGYVAVDAYEEEPTRDHPLFHLDNAICTPHLGYVEKDSYEILFGHAFDNLLAFEAGHPVNLVNPDVLGAEKARS